MEEHEYNMLGINILPDYKDFAEVSKMFVDGYSRFVLRGLPEDMVARAMLDAAINFYYLIGTPSELPSLFRYLADKIEGDPQPSRLTAGFAS